MKRQHIEKEEEVLRQITEANVAVRREYRMIKTGRADADRVCVDILNPVVTPLKALVEKEKPIELKKAVEIKEDKGGKEEENKKRPMCYKRPVKLCERTWLDTVQGIRDSGSQLMLGDLAVQTHGNQLMVAGKSCTLTPGLLELLLKKHPQMSQITPQDSEDYQAMVASTNTNRKRYLKTGPIRSSAMEKNQTLYEKRKRLGTLCDAGEPRTTDYVYWVDPSELSDRLQLLAASYQAGNKSHANKIMSSLEGLREADLIEYCRGLYKS